MHFQALLLKACEGYTDRDDSTLFAGDKDVIIVNNFGAEEKYSVI